MVDLNTQIPGVVVSRIEGVDSKGQPLARWDEGMTKPQSVHPVWMDPEPDWSACTGLRCILGFEEGKSSTPFLLGLIDSPEKVQPEVKIFDKHETAGQAGDGAACTPEKLRVESNKELIIECGKAKIALRADGRIVIQGGYLLSRSKGVNKIKGGSVQIN